MKSKLYMVSGCVYAALTILISRWLLFNLDILWTWLCPLFHLSNSLTEHITLVLQQFHSASIGSPWLPMLLIGAFISFLASCKKKRQGLFFTVLYIVLWVPFLVLTLWFTTINDIRLGALLLSALRLFT